MVVAWSQESIQSGWVLDEAADGRDRDILVPLSLDGTKPPLGFRGLQTPNFQDWTSDSKDNRIEQLIVGVRRVVQMSWEKARQERQAREEKTREEEIARQRDIARREELARQVKIAWQQKARPKPTDREIDQLPQRLRVGLVFAVLAAFLVIALGAAAFWQRDRVAALFDAVLMPAQQIQKDTDPTKPANPAAPVVQRVVLYEEDPNDAHGKRDLGSAIWRTETPPPSANAPADLSVRADIEIPERRITMTFSLRRNTDQAMPASHTVEVMFNLPADFPFGGISSVPGILMKEGEQPRGTPLAGLAVKVTSGYFLVGLSAVESDLKQNLKLMKERPWLDIPLVYNNGRRAILAIEKGTPGERAFEEAFKAWGQ